jgi:hypothetical protein
MMLLVKDDGGWKIVAQAWDTEKNAGLHLPNELAESHYRIADSSGYVIT